MPTDLSISGWAAIFMGEMMGLARTLGMWWRDIKFIWQSYGAWYADFVEMPLFMHVRGKIL